MAAPRIPPLPAVIDADASATGHAAHAAERSRALQRSRPSTARIVTLAAALALASLTAGGARADKIRNGTAVFSGLDKITGRIISFKAGMGETVQFGSLQVTARACFTRPAKEAPQTDTFVEIDEVSAKREFKRIFSGWMFAASPGLNGLEHPIYDIWLTGCDKPGETIVEAPQTADADGNAVASAPTGAEAVPPPPPDAPPPPRPKPKRIARPAPRSDAPVAERREPTQRFFPASQYPTDPPARQPADVDD